MEYAEMTFTGFTEIIINEEDFTDGDKEPSDRAVYDVRNYVIVRDLRDLMTRFQRDLSHLAWFRTDVTQSSLPIDERLRDQLQDHIKMLLMAIIKICLVRTFITYNVQPRIWKKDWKLDISWKFFFRIDSINLKCQEFWTYVN